MRFAISGTHCNILLEPLHAFFDIFHGVGVGKPQIALTVLAEINSGCDTDMRFFEDIECQLIGIV